MVRALGVIAAQTPGGDAKDQYEEKKEPAGYFEEDDAADTAERPEKTADSTSDASADAGGRGPSLAGARTGVCLCTCGGRGSRIGWRRREALARHAAGHTEPYA